MAVTREEVIAELKRRGYNGPIPGEQAQQQNQSQLIQSLQQLTPKKNMGHRVADAISVFAGGNPVPVDEPNDYSKLYAQEAIKSQFKDPSYVVSYDKEGNPIFTQAPGDIKNAPFYSTPQGGKYYEAKTEQSQAQGKQATTETNLMNQVLPAVENAMKGNQGNLPPGASVSAGPITFQPNPRLTDTEQGVISGFDKFEPIAQEIEGLLRQGVLSSGVSRNYTQFLAEPGNNKIRRMLTKDDSPLEKLQSAASEMQKYAFSEGGKTLSPTEMSVVMAGLSFQGKGDAQAIHDFKEAIRILRSKKALALGGRNAATQGSGGSSQSYTIGQVIQGPDGKPYRITGLSDPNDPDVEPV